MKITKSQLVQIIKEEAESFKKELKLKRELAEIEKQLNEVHANGEMSSTEDDGVHAGQKKPVFKKKGSHLIEVEDEGNDQEALLNALKTIASACGLTGTIELDSEEEVEMGDEEDVDVDVVEPETSDEEGEEEGQEAEEDEIEEVDMEEDSMEEGEMEEEGVKEEGEMEEEGVKEEGEMEEEGVKEEGEMEEEGVKEENKVMNESFERKRMMELAGIKK
jgi:hypothetical protein